MDAHISIDDVAASRKPLELWIGNEYAGRLANKAASIHAIPQVEVLNFRFTVGKAFKVQKRLLAVNRLALQTGDEGELFSCMHPFPQE